jgi:hypothetical protein
MRNQREHIEQCTLIHWTEMIGKKYPNLLKIYAVPNGGHRHPIVAKKLKAEGVKKGIPDLCLPIARKGYHALYIEMKADEKCRLSDNQVEKICELESDGNMVVVAHGWLESARALCNYLDIPKDTFGEYHE